MTCKHRNTVFGEDRCYSGGGDDLDPRSAGGVEWSETCTDCDAVRGWQSSAGYSDSSEWSVPLGVQS